MMRHISLAVPVSERDHSQGPATAEITLVQYGDYDCPYTRRSTWVVQAIRPATAFYSQQMGEFLLHYDDMRSALSPEQALLEFFQSTYEAGTTLGRWDREALERNPI